MRRDKPLGYNDEVVVCAEEDGTSCNNDNSE